MEAIVYTSNSGFTAEYARLLGEKTGLPVYSMKEAKSAVSAGSSIIYLGWLMASSIKGYAKAAQRYRICMVCAVGMGASGTQIAEARKASKVDDSIPLFTLQGGFDINRLHGIYRFMMNTMKRTAGKALQQKVDRTPDEDDMLDLMVNGGNRVSLENLAPVLSWYEQSK